MDLDRLMAAVKAGTIRTVTLIVRPGRTTITAFIPAEDPAPGAIIHAGSVFVRRGYSDEFELVPSVNPIATLQTA